MHVDGRLAGIGRYIEQTWEIAVGVRPTTMSTSFSCSRNLWRRRSAMQPRTPSCRLAAVLRLLGPEVAQTTANLLFRILADGAGVDEHDIGGIGIMRQPVAIFAENRGHDLAV
jgi:hypothetical protein